MKISFQAKFNSKSLLEVYIDNRIWGVLPKKLLKTFLNLSEIDNEEFKSLKEKLYLYGRDRLFNYLAKQEHSEFESRNYLKKLKLNSALIEDIIAFCLEKNFISDNRLTELYTRSLIDLGKSKSEIRFKLQSKGINKEIIESELDEQYNTEARTSIIHENIDKAIKIYRSREDKDLYNKCCSYMMRKGFKYSDFSDYLKEQINNEEDLDLY